MSNAPHDSLQRAAAKASLDPFFLGHLLAFDSKGSRRSDAEIAKRLKCDAAQIARLALCRCPREDAAWFRKDIEKIADFVGCDVSRLAQMVRESASLRALARTSGVRQANTLLAARDRLPKRDDPTNPQRDSNE